MPEQGRRIYATQTIRFSKTVDAPPRYVYDWCTDFRNDDGRLSRSKPGFQVVHPRPGRVVRIRSLPARGKDKSIAVELVRLNPPNAWHVDQIDETDLDSVDYEVTRLGPRRSRITLHITERWMTPKHPTEKEVLEGTSSHWDRIVAALETDYRSGRPAKG